MTRSTFFLATLLLGAASVILYGAPAAKADTLFDVENARANARAGRLIDDQQIEYLERYGALSGTPWIRRGERFSYYFNDEPVRYHRRLHHRRHWR
jgi:hypothetical protein